MGSGVKQSHREHVGQDCWSRSWNASRIKQESTALAGVKHGLIKHPLILRLTDNVRTFLLKSKKHQNRFLEVWCGLVDFLCSFQTEIERTEGTPLTIMP